MWFRLLFFPGNTAAFKGWIKKCDEDGLAAQQARAEHGDER